MSVKFLVNEVFEVTTHQGRSQSSEQDEAIFAEGASR